MLTPPLPLLPILLLVLVLALPAQAKYPDDLPPAEKAIAGTVDPWGLPCSDSLLRAMTQMIAEGKIKGAKAKQLQALLDPTPYILVHSQYWDRLPETLLRRRTNILRTLAE